MNRSNRRPGILPQIIEGIVLPFYLLYVLIKSRLFFLLMAFGLVIAAGKFAIGMILGFLLGWTGFAVRVRGSHIAPLDYVGMLVIIVALLFLALVSYGIFRWQKVTVFMHAHRLFTLAVLSALVVGGYQVSRHDFSSAEEQAFRAVDHNDVEGVERYLEAHPPPDQEQLTRLLFTAVSEPTTRPAIVSRVLAAGVDVNVALGEGRWTPLMNASEKGDPAMVEWLLAHGADVNARNADQQTALLWAVAHRNDGEKSLGKVVEILLAAGAEKHVVDRYHNSPLTLAQQRGFMTIIPLLQ